jgi:hypothetical protein
MYTSWFSSVMQVVNNITMLAVILTGAALIREREQGTVEHLLVMPLVPAEIMLAKIVANGLVILIAAGLSLSLVIQWWLKVPIAGSLSLYSGGRRASRLYRRRARHPARDANLDQGTVRTACNSSSRRHATPVWRRDADGEHAGLASTCHADRQSDATLRCFLTGRSLSRRRLLDRLAVACRDGRDRQRPFCLLVAPFPPRHLR